MIHVLFLPKWYPNPIDPFDGNFIENHAQAIKRVAELSVIFVHSQADLAKAKYHIEEKDNKGIYEIRAYYQKPTSGIGFLDKVISFFRFRKAQKLAYSKLLTQKSKPDLVHIHVLSRPALLALRLKYQYNIPFLITEHWSGYLKSNGAYRGFLKKRFTEWIVKKASAVHTVSTELKEAMISHGLKNRYTVIPNVVDEELFHSNSKKNPRTEIIFVGNLLESPKRIFRIIRAMKLLKNNQLDFRLRIYGEGKDEIEAQSITKQEGLSENIEFCGTASRSGIAEAMANSDFLVLFSEFENQPCVISEAHASGIPVIVPDLKGIAERMKPELGLMVKTGNQEDFEAAVLKMYREHQNYSSEKIREYGVQVFGEKAIAQQFSDLYLSVLKND